MDYVVSIESGTWRLPNAAFHSATIALPLLHQLSRGGRFRMRSLPALRGNNGSTTIRIRAASAGRCLKRQHAEMLSRRHVALNPLPNRAQYQSTRDRAPRAYPPQQCPAVATSERCAGAFDVGLRLLFSVR